MVIYDMTEKNTDICASKGRDEKLCIITLNHIIEL